MPPPMTRRQCLDCKLWVETDERWIEFWCDDCRKYVHCIICDVNRANHFCDGCLDAFCSECSVEHNFAECQSHDSQAFEK